MSNRSAAGRDEGGTTSSVLALDVGSVSTVAAVPGLGVVLDEPTATLAHPARRGWGPWPGTTEWIAENGSPSSGSTISDSEVLGPEVLVQVIRSVVDRLGGGSVERRVVLSIPVGMAEPERETVREAARAAGVASSVTLVEAPQAVALSLLDAGTEGTVVVADVGASITQAAVVSMSAIDDASPTGVTVHRSAVGPIGSQDLDGAIRDTMIGRHGVVLGDTTVIKVKETVGSAWPTADFASEVRGWSITPGEARSAVLAPGELRDAVEGVVDAIVEVVEGVLDPPSEIPGRRPTAVWLSGGGSLLGGLAERVADVTGLPTVVVDHPRLAVAHGLALHP